MSKKQAETVTPENVDDMTDEQLTEFMSGMQEEGDEGGKVEQTEEKPVEAKQEQQEDPQDDGDEPPKAETVDFKRFDYERNRRREAERLAAEKEAEWARRFDELLKAQKGPEKAEPEKPAIPEWEEDPFARMQTVEQRLEEFISGVRGQTEEQKAAQQRQQQEEWAIATADQTFARAATQNPDLQDAMNFAVQAVQSELQKKGYYGPAFQQEYRNQLVHYAVNAPQDPAEFAEYVRRNARYWGWNGPQQQAQPEQAHDTSEAQRKARTLSNGGGSPGVSDSISPEQLLSMSDKEFDAYIAKHGSVASVFSQ